MHVRAKFEVAGGKLCTCKIKIKIQHVRTKPASAAAALPSFARAKVARSHLPFTEAGFARGLFIRLKFTQIGLLRVFIPIKKLADLAVRQPSSRSKLEGCSASRSSQAVLPVVERNC